MYNIPSIPCFKIIDGWLQGNNTDEDETEDEEFDEDEMEDGGVVMGVEADVGLFLLLLLLVMVGGQEAGTDDVNAIPRRVIIGDVWWVRIQLWPYFKELQEVESLGMEEEIDEVDEEEEEENR